MKNFFLALLVFRARSYLKIEWEKDWGDSLLIFLLVLFSFCGTLARASFKREQPKTRASLGWAQNRRSGGDPASHGSVVRGICLQKKILETSHVLPDSLCNVVTAKH